MAADAAEGWMSRQARTVFKMRYQTLVDIFPIEYLARKDIVHCQDFSIVGLS